MTEIDDETRERMRAEMLAEPPQTGPALTPVDVIARVLTEWDEMEIGPEDAMEEADAVLDALRSAGYDPEARYEQVVAAEHNELGSGPLYRRVEGR